MRYLYDRQRHLICMPYSVEGLHKMAADLGIKRCWYHVGKWPHYDIPKRRGEEIAAKAKLVSVRRLLFIIKATDMREYRRRNREAAEFLNANPPRMTTALLQAYRAKPDIYDT